MLGDSGGPFIRLTEERDEEKTTLKWILFGIISHAFDHLCRIDYTVFVNVPMFIDWIHENSKFFDCKGGLRKRVPLVNYCDGTRNCDDESDEKQCSKSKKNSLPFQI